MLEKHGARISGAERARIEDDVAAMRARINDAGSHGGPTVSHPTVTRDALPVAPIESSLATSQVAPTEAIEHANQVASIEAIGSPRPKKRATDWCAERAPNVRPFRRWTGHVAAVSDLAIQMAGAC